MTFEFPRCAPYLVLAGDIGRLVDYELYLEFLRWQCDRFTLVFLVLGNHEFYGTSRADGLRAGHRLQSEPILRGRLKLLQQGRFDVGPCAILGCTLNSYISLKAQEVVRSKVKDFRKIKDWTIEKHNASHLDDVRWLEGQIESINAEKGLGANRIMVITHHAPTTQQTSRPDEARNPQSSAFATDLIFQKTSPFSNVQYWIYGHTYYSNMFSIGSTKLFSNQRGYVFPGCPQPNQRTWSRCLQRFQVLGRGFRKPQTFNPRATVAI